MGRLKKKQNVEKSISNRDAKKNAQIQNMQVKEETRTLMRKIRIILRKHPDDLTEAEKNFLQPYPILVDQIKIGMNRRETAKARLIEVEDPSDVLSSKCKLLAEAIKSSNCTVVYTGAGISTAAAIPDYRGPNGVWTQLQKGLQVKSKNLIDAEPTFTHMALTALHHQGLIHHLSSQNCDGLHLRSGFPRKSLSELHGNMFIELCSSCKPQREYIRLFDVTTNTSFRRHKTGNICDKCKKDLLDTIVHFGEKGKMESPQNWPQAATAAEKCDLIICLGSSLKVLKKYHCLWGTNRSLKHRPKLFIVNLQWTPKDDSASLKINGKCDPVMMEVMKNLAISTPVYSKQNDPIFHLASEPTHCCDVKWGKRLVRDEYKPSSLPHLSDHDYVESTKLHSNYDHSSFCLASDRNKCKLIQVKSEEEDCKDSLSDMQICETDVKTEFENPGWFGKGYNKGRRKRKKM